MTVMTTDPILTALEHRFDSIDRSFEAVNARFDAVDQRLDGMDQRLDGMDQRLDSMDRRLDGMDQRLDGMDRRLDGMDQRLELLEADLGAHRIETAQEFKELRIEMKADSERVVERFERLYRLMLYAGVAVIVTLIAVNAT